MASSVAQGRIKNAGSLRTFHLFNNLPKELQLKVLRFVFETPRVIPVQAGYGKLPDKRPDSQYKKVDYHVYWSDSLEPAIMMVNKEIRAEAMHSGFYRNLSSVIKEPYNYHKRCHAVADLQGDDFATYCTNIWVGKNDLVCPTNIHGSYYRSLPHLCIQTLGWIMHDAKVERIALDTLSCSVRFRLNNGWSLSQPWVLVCLTPYIREIVFYEFRFDREVHASTTFIAEASDIIRSSPGFFLAQPIIHMFRAFDESMDALERLKEQTTIQAAPWLYENPRLFVRPSLNYMKIK
jgi:hypothetical protein